MYHTISDIYKTINLQQYIDNRDGCKRVGLKSFTYTLDWYNLENSTVQIIKGELFKIPPGYYNFNQLSDYLETINITIDVNATNGIATMTSLRDVKISTQLRNILGFITKKKLNANETYIGDMPVDFAIIKNIYVHLEQLNTYNNYFDGKHSTLLGVVPIENKKFGDITTFRFEHPEYKTLMNGTISEFKLTIRDENGKQINNNEMPISCVLEVI